MIIKLRKTLQLSYREVFSNNMVYTTVLFGKEESNKKIRYLILFFEIQIEKTNSHKKMEKTNYATA